MNTNQATHNEILEMATKQAEHQELITKAEKMAKEVMKANPGIKCTVSASGGLIMESRNFQRMDVPLVKPIDKKMIDYAKILYVGIFIVTAISVILLGMGKIHF